jgi:hypothetical protein
MNHQPTRRVAALTVTMAAAALCLTACGSSSTGSSTSSAAAGSSGAPSAPAGAGPAASSATRAKLSACLKSHGVTLPARPGGRRPNGSGAGGGGGFGGGGAGAPGGFANNPKLRAAIQACGGGARFGQRRTFTRAAVQTFVTCVKQHGYDLPAPNYSGKGPTFPASIQTNPKFQSASRACAADLRGPGTAAPGSAPPPTPGA